MAIPGNTVSVSTCGCAVKRVVVRSVNNQLEDARSQPPDFISSLLNPLSPRQNGRYFAADIFKCIFLNDNAWISLKISLKFVPKVRINNIPSLVQKMAWRRPGDKPLSEPMMVSLLTHICVTRPQLLNGQDEYTLGLWIPKQINDHETQNILHVGYAGFEFKEALLKLGRKEISLNTTLIENWQCMTETHFPPASIKWQRRQIWKFNHKKYIPRVPKRSFTCRINFFLTRLLQFGSPVNSKRTDQSDSSGNIQ